MRQSLVILSIFVISGPLSAQPGDEPKNVLSLADARGGRILLFDGETTYGWDVTGDVRVENGLLILSNEGKGRIQSKGFFPPDFELTLKRKGGLAVSFWHTPDFATAGRIPEAKGWRFESIDFDSSHRIAPAISLSTGRNGAVELHTIALIPRSTQSLFNAKDLTGWKIFDGKKSKFEVKDGLLSIENGPGDLQTEKPYKNFLLQLECKTNGMHLNSGVFFRCRAGEYQNGYEAQINNNFTTEAAKDYVVESFDPKTNELLEKKTVKSAAVDYGTGAIYRRIPARKSVAKDGEWFTLTVLAHGNHFATWVDGIQTVDWYDNRPPSDNARTGYRAEGGHISLQGHDPTTNLSFRNIRIATLPD